jgi:hypothetical protein
MNSLLNPKLWDQDIEGSIQDSHDFSLADHRPISLSEIGDKDTQEQVSRLLLGENG